MPLFPASGRRRRDRRWLAVFALVGLLCLRAGQGGFAAEASTEAAAAAPAAAAENQETEEERRERIAREREEVIAKAKQDVETTDEAIMEKLPEGVKTVVGYQIYQIALWRYVVVIGLFFGALAALAYLRRRFQAKDKESSVEEMEGWRLALHVARLGVVNPLKLALLGVTLKIFTWLVVTRYHPEIMWMSNMILYLAVVFYLYDLIGLVDEYYGNRLFHSRNRLLDTVRPLIVKAARILLLVLAAIHVYQSITGQTLVSIFAGLGIGGLALALASQETLKNLLGFANIAFDQSFLVGDYVVLGSEEGTVEHVGMRSMRVRKPDGTSVIIPNSNAITSNVTNKARLPFQRRTITLNLHPANGSAKIETALAEVKAALDGHNGAVMGKPPLVVFDDFAPCRVNIVAYFWFDPGSGFDYVAEVDRINRDIYRRLSAAEVLFAER